MSDTHDRAREIAEQIAKTHNCSCSDPDGPFRPCETFCLDHVEAVASALLAERRDAETKLAAAREALTRIANINEGPDQASGEWRCQEAVEIARAALSRSGQPADDGTSHE